MNDWLKFDPSKEEIVVSCPSCKSESKAIIYHKLISLGGDFIAKRILNDEINIVNCKKCLTNFHVPNGFYYGNSEKDIAMYYHPTTFEKVEKKIVPEGKKVFEKKFQPTLFKHHDWNEFKRQIRSVEIVEFNREGDYLKVLNEYKGNAFSKMLLESILVMFADIMFKKKLVFGESLNKKEATKILNVIYEKMIAIGDNTRLEFEKIETLLSPEELERHPAKIRNDDYIFILNNWGLIIEAWKEFFRKENRNTPNSDIWTCDICGGSADTGCLFSDSTECPKHT